MRSRRRRARRGLSILETMLALAILGGTMAALGELVRTGTTASKRASTSGVKAAPFSVWKSASPRSAAIRSNSGTAAAMASTCRKPFVFVNSNTAGRPRSSGRRSLHGDCSCT